MPSPTKGPPSAKVADLLGDTSEIIRPPMPINEPLQSIGESSSRVKIEPGAVGPPAMTPPSSGRIRDRKRQGKSPRHIISSNSYKSPKGNSSAIRKSRSYGKLDLGGSDHSQGQSQKSTPKSVGKSAIREELKTMSLNDHQAYIEKMLQSVGLADAANFSNDTDVYVGPDVGQSWQPPSSRTDDSRASSQKSSVRISQAESDRRLSSLMGDDDEILISRRPPMVPKAMSTRNLIEAPGRRQRTEKGESSERNLKGDRSLSSDGRRRKGSENGNVQIPEVHRQSRSRSQDGRNRSGTGNLQSNLEIQALTGRTLEGDRYPKDRREKRSSSVPRPSRRRSRSRAKGETRSNSRDGNRRTRDGLRKMIRSHRTDIPDSDEKMKSSRERDASNGTRPNTSGEIQLKSPVSLSGQRFFKGVVSHSKSPSDQRHSRRSKEGRRSRSSSRPRTKELRSFGRHDHDPLTLKLPLEDFVAIPSSSKGHKSPRKSKSDQNIPSISIKPDSASSSRVDSDYSKSPSDQRSRRRSKQTGGDRSQDFSRQRLKQVQSSYHDTSLSLQLPLEDPSLEVHRSSKNCHSPTKSKSDQHIRSSSRKLNTRSRSNVTGSSSLNPRNRRTQPKSLSDIPGASNHSDGGARRTRRQKDPSRENSGNQSDSDLAKSKTPGRRLSYQDNNHPSYKSESKNLAESRLRTRRGRKTDIVGTSDHTAGSSNSVDKNTTNISKKLHPSGKASRSASKGSSGTTKSRQRDMEKASILIQACGRRLLAKFKRQRLEDATKSKTALAQKRSLRGFRFDLETRMCQDTVFSDTVTNAAARIQRLIRIYQSKRELERVRAVNMERRVTSIVVLQRIVRGFRAKLLTEGIRKRKEIEWKQEYAKYEPYKEKYLDYVIAQRTATENQENLKAEIVALEEKIAKVDEKFERERKKLTDSLEVQKKVWRDAMEKRIAQQMAMKEKEMVAGEGSEGWEPLDPSMTPEEHQSAFEEENAMMKEWLENTSAKVESKKAEAKELEKANAEVEKMFHELNDFAKKKVAEKKEISSQQLMLTNMLIPKAKKQSEEATKEATKEVKVRLLCRRHLYKVLEGLQASDEFDHQLYEDTKKAIQDCEAEVGSQYLEGDGLNELLLGDLEALVEIHASKLVDLESVVTNSNAASKWGTVSKGIFSNIGKGKKLSLQNLKAEFDMDSD